jgi:hypothetical protein
MAALVAAIHVFPATSKTWMAGASAGHDDGKTVQYYWNSD